MLILVASCNPPELFGADKPKANPWIISAPKPLASVDPQTLEVKYNDGTDAKDVVKVLIGQLAQYDKALSECRKALEPKPKKK